MPDIILPDIISVSNSSVRGYGIFAIDPGGKTGLCWGWMNAEAESVGDALRRARRRGSLFAKEVAGPPELQAHVIYDAWSTFRVQALSYGVGTELVCEDFQLRQRSADLTPVEVIGGFKTLCAKSAIEKITDDKLQMRTSKVVAWSREFVPKIVWQGPSAAKSFATNQRLRDWDAWFVGSEHMRDASRHLALRLSNILR